MNRIENWKGVMEKMRNKLSSWKARALSFGGRLTLVKSVLGSLTLYFFLLFRALRGVIRELERIRYRFFWGGGGGGDRGLNSHRGVTWVKWERVLRDKKNGGLGVGSLLASNLGLVGKWWWRFHREEDVFWVKVVKSIFGIKEGLEGGESRPR